MSLIAAAERILLQFENLLCLINPSDYTRPSGILDQSTIGQHTRHSIEFFLCLKEGVSHSYVNYDNRKRDRTIEEDLDSAKAVLSELADFLVAQKSDLPLNLRSQPGFEDDESLEISTTYYRELLYNIEHAVHHMALIRVAVNELCPYISLPADFGVASSTIRSKSFSK